MRFGARLNGSSLGKMLTANSADTMFRTLRVEVLVPVRRRLRRQTA
jgi:hypothetical protein